MFKNKTKAKKSVPEQKPDEKAPEMTSAEWEEYFSHQGRFQYNFLIMMQRIATALEKTQEAQEKRNEILEGSDDETE